MAIELREEKHILYIYIGEYDVAASHGRYQTFSRDLHRAISAEIAFTRAVQDI